MNVSTETFASAPAYSSNEVHVTINCSVPSDTATLSEPYDADALPQVPYDQLPRPRLCYVEIPAIDAQQSATFYEKLFGWNIRHRATLRPSFDDASGLSGAWVTGRSISREPGLLPYIWVNDIDATVSNVAALGGEERNAEERVALPW